MMNPSDRFEIVVREYYEPLFRFALSLARVEADAWDLTQQTFHIWAMKGHQLRDGSKVQSWLFTTLHRAFLVGRKRQARFSEAALDELLMEPAVPTADPTEYPDCTTVLPALAKLDNIYQAAVALYYLKGCSYKDITAILGVPLGTVKSRIARGMAQLRVLLSSEQSDPSLSQLGDV